MGFGIIASVLLFAIWTGAWMSVDFSKAKYEPGQLVELKLGGGQAHILKRWGHNERHSWNYIPVFEYRIREKDHLGCQHRSDIYEWEIERRVIKHYQISGDQT